jgi:uncharacterized protein DUF4149
MECMNALKFFMIFALAAWIGGILYFTVADAPTILALVADRQLGGSIISESLWKLHWIGIGSGLVFLVASLRYSHLVTGEARAFMPSHFLVLVMLAMTLISQRAVLPAVALLRTAALSTEVQAQFTRLHTWSIGLEMGTLLLGLLLMYLTARRLS